MKILIFTENYYAGGMDTFIINLLNAWPANDQFTLVYNHNHPGARIISQRLVKPCALIAHRASILDNVVIGRKMSPLLLFFIRSFIFFTRYLFFIYHVIYFVGTIRDIVPEKILVVAGGYPGGSTPRAIVVSTFVARLCGIRLNPVFVYHSESFRPRMLLRPIEYIIDKIVEKQAFCLVAVSQDSNNSLNNRAPFIHSLKKRVILNGAPPQLPLETSSASLKEFDKPCMLLLGTYDENKGHAFFLRTLCIVHKRFPTARVIFAGSGYASERERVQGVARSLDIETSVTLLHFQNDTRHLFEKADILVLPSQISECFPYVIVEALSYGIPVIATDIGGIPEVLHEGEGGYTVPRDEKKFAEKIIELLENDSLRVELSRRGYKAFNERFSAERMAKDYYDLLMQS